MKKYMLFAVALAALGSCADESFVGDESQREANENAQGAIVFGTGVNTVTRANISDVAAAELLNNNFVLFGSKGTTRTNVFNNYQANYVANTANTTESNSNGWEYVGYYNVPDGITATTGVTAFASSADNANKVDQTIKYWDYAATQYDFAAYSLGKGAGTTPTYAKATAISFANLGTKAYEITGSADELKACYISDLVTAYNVNDNTNNIHISNYGTPVEFSFRSLAAKIRIAFYETIPGYSVKDVKFYTSSSAITTTDDPTLFTSTTVLPSGSGTMKVYFPTTGLANRNATDYNKAHVSFTQASGSTAASTLPFGVLANYPTSYEGKLTTGSYIGRTSNTATYADGGTTSGETFTANAQGTYYTILPNETGANLQLRIKYTLVATDGYDETITVDKATAVVPAELAKWQPNYAYTYIFKIGDMTNGSTGEDGDGNVVMGLTPITLDAVVVGSEDGVQETITTVSTPSITTYAKGEVVTANDEYVADKNIYVIVNNGTANETLTNKANLYTVTLAESTDDGDNPETKPSQPISEESVANAFANGTTDDNDHPTTWTVKDANKWKLTLTKSNLMTLVDVIDAADSPTGNEISIGTKKVGKFTPAAGTTYAFQYEVAAGEAADTYTDETAAAYNATLPGAITTTDVAYSFTSYADNTGSGTQYGSGKVKEVSKEGGWTTVLVTSNTSTDTNAANFVGQQFYVKATELNTETYYQLYSTNEDSAGLPIYVKVTSSTFTDADVNAYNATLPGAVSSGVAKPAVPAKYQYKIIKVKS